MVERIAIRQLDLSAAEVILPNLQTLLNGAYHDSHMYQDLQADIELRPDPFKLLLAHSVSEMETPVGVTVVEHKPHEGFDYLGYTPIHLKRFTVAKAMRNLGIGKSLIEQAKQFAFHEVNTPVLFGESNEYGALSFYGREGAYYNLETIHGYMRRNSPSDALRFFAIDLSEPRFRTRRYPNGQGIHFAFPVDKVATELLKARGYISKPDLMSHSE